MLKTRVISGCVGALLLIAVLLCGETVLRIAVGLVSALMTIELFRAVKLRSWIIIPSGLFAAILAANVLQDRILFPAFSLYILVMLCIMLFSYNKLHMQDIATATLFSLFVGLSMGCLSRIRVANDGAYWIWLVFLGAWGSDVFAYFTGSWFGTKKLMPAVSPKKTVEGAIGGTLGASICFLLFGLIIGGLGNIHPISLFFAGALSSLCGQLGDLTASVIKRQYGIKDYGKIMPGHGGTMDRFDSILFVAPIVYICMMFIQ